ncbi:hypothetical protein MATL_G00058660 [Megalops atlanticus]|uniref:Centromere-associated protein E n=1 Tax=Megalops atlanticus TaxID=7932 RepID=A0A9D3Q6H1_MEGAT|nr:hypothetical protein MATL_G00058660 [Megalops atlanticus]
MTEESAVKVCVRIRPLIQREEASAESAEQVPLYWKADKQTVCQIDDGNVSKSFSFDRVFTAEESTNQLYQDIAKPLVVSAVEGYNGTIFAYGQTSSGKTFTMMGSSHEPGVIPLAMEDVFKTIKNCPKKEFLLRVSYMEIYNETVTDLLCDSWKRKPLEIREGNYKNVYVADLTEELVTSAEQAISWIKKGEKNRHYGKTKMNQRSSRSHTIFRMILESRERSDPAAGENADGAIIVSHLNLVDLAGAERASQTGAEGARLKEGCNINRSLFTLGQVIKKLSDENQGGFTNYRDSKLTRILQNSLGGNAKTVIICTITPATVDETLSTLQFASTAKRMKNDPHVTEVSDDGALLRRYRNEIVDLKRRLHEVSSVTQTTVTEKEVLAQLLQEKDQLQREQEDRIRNLTRIIVTSKNFDAVEKKIPKRRVTWGGKLLRSVQPDDFHIGDSEFGAPEPFVKKRKTDLSTLPENDEDGEEFTSGWEVPEDLPFDIEMNQSNVTMRSLCFSDSDFVSPVRADELSEKIASLELQLQTETQQKQEAAEMSASLERRVAELERQLEAKAQEIPHDVQEEYKKDLGDTIQLCEALVSEKNILTAERDLLQREYDVLREENQILTQEKEHLQKEIEEQRELQEFRELEQESTKQCETELVNEISSLKTAAEKSAISIQKLEADMAALSAELKRKEEWIEELQNLNDKDLVQQIQQLKQSLQDAETLSIDTKKEWAFLRSENLSLKERDTTMTADYEKMKAEVTALSRKLEAENARFKKMQADLQKELQGAFEENTKLTTLLDGKVPRNLIDSVQLERTVSDLKKELEAYQERERSLQTKLEELEALKDLPAQVDNLNKKICSLTEELVAVQAERDGLLSAQAGTDAEMQRLTGEAQQAQDELADTRAKLSDAEMRGDHMTQQHLDATKKLEGLGAELEHLREEKQQLLSTFEELNLNLEKSRENERSIEEKLCEQQLLVKDLEKKIVDDQQSFKHTEEHFSDLSKQHQDQIQQLVVELEGVREERSQMEKNLQRNMEMIKQLNEELESVRSERDALQSERTGAAQIPEEELEKFRSHLTSITEERDQLQQILEGVREERSQLNRDLQEKEEMVVQIQEELRQQQHLQSEQQTLREQEQAQLQQQSQQQHEELEGMKEERSQLKSDLQEKEEMLVQVQEELRQQQHLNSEKQALREGDQVQLQQQIQQLSEELEGVKEEKNQLKVDLQENVEMMIENQEELRAAQEKIRKQQETVKDLETQISQLQARLLNSNVAEDNLADLENLNDKIKKLNEELESVRSERDALQSERTGAAQIPEEELEKFRSHLASLTEERDQLQQILEGVREERSQLNRDLQEKEEMVVQVQEELRQQQHLNSEQQALREEEQAQLQQQIQQLGEELQGMRDEGSQLKSDLQEREEMLLQVQEELRQQHLSLEQQALREQEQAQLQQQIQQLGEELERMRDEKSQLKSDLQEKEEMLVQVQEELRQQQHLNSEQQAVREDGQAQLQQRIQQLDEELEGLREEKKQLKTDLQENVEMMIENQEELRAAQEKIKKQQETVKDLETQISQLQARLLNSNVAEDNLADLENLNDKIKQLNEQLESVRSERDALQSERTGTAQIPEEELEKFRSHLSSITEERDQLQQILEGVREERSQLNRDLQEKEEMVVQIQEELRQQQHLNSEQQALREEQQAQLQQQIIQLNEELELVRSERDALQSERTGAVQISEEELEKLRSHLSSITEERDQLQQILEGVREERSQLNRDLQEKEEMVVQIQEELRQQQHLSSEQQALREEEQAQLQQQIQQLGEELERMRDEKSQLKSDLQEKEEMLVQVQEELRQQQHLNSEQQAVREDGQAQQQIQQLGDELQGMRDERSQLKRDLQEREEMLVQVQEELRQQQHLNSEQQAVREEAQAQLQQQIQQLGEELQGIRDERSQLKSDLQEREEMVAQIQNKLIDQQQLNSEQENMSRQKQAEYQQIQQLGEELEGLRKESQQKAELEKASQELLSEANLTICSLKEQISSLEQRSIQTDEGEQRLRHRLEESEQQLQEMFEKYQRFIDNGVSASKTLAQPLKEASTVQNDLMFKLLPCIPKPLTKLYVDFRKSTDNINDILWRTAWGYAHVAKVYRRQFEAETAQDVALSEEARLQDLLVHWAQSPGSTLSLKASDIQEVWDQRLSELLEKREQRLQKMKSVLAELEEGIVKNEGTLSEELPEQQRTNEELRALSSVPSPDLRALENLLAQERVRRTKVLQNKKSTFLHLQERYHQLDKSLQKFKEEAGQQLKEERSKSMVLMQNQENSPGTTETDLLQNSKQLLLKLQQSEKDLKMMQVRVNELEEAQAKADERVSTHKQATQLLQTKLQDVRAELEEKENAIQNLKKQLQDSQAQVQALSGMASTVEMEKMKNELVKMELEQTALSTKHQEEMKKMNTLLQHKEEALRKLKETLRKAQQQDDDSFMENEAMCFNATAATGGRTIQSTAMTEKNRLEDVKQLKKTETLESLVPGQHVEMARWKGRPAKLKENKREALSLETPLSPHTPTKKSRLITSEGHVLASPKSKFFDAHSVSESMSANCPRQFFDNSNLGTTPDFYAAEEDKNAERWPLSPKGSDMCKAQ